MFERHKTPKMMVHPGQQDDGQGVIARLEADEQLSASGGWHAGTLTTPTLDAVPARARRLSVWGDIIRLAAISRAKPAAERCRATVEPNGCLSARASNGGFSGFCAERERARARFLTLRPAVSSFAGESLVRRWPGLDSSGTLRWRKGSLRSRS